MLGTCPVRWHPDEFEWYEKWEIGRTAATTDWSHGLQGNDAHVVRITKNVLERLGR